MTETSFTTSGGIAVRRHARERDADDALEALIDAIDTRRGVLLASSYEYPGRYTRWSLGFVDPPIAVTGRERRFDVAALNARGLVLLDAIEPALRDHPHLDAVTREADRLTGAVHPPAHRFSEEERSRQASLFSVLRAIRDLFASAEDPHLGLYGAFAYDLVEQFEPITRAKPRADDQRDLVLYLPDRLTVIDYQRRRALEYGYDFTVDGRSTIGLEGGGAGYDPHGARLEPEKTFDFPPGGYADLVRATIPYFARGDLYEAVPGQSFYRACSARPSDLFRQLRAINPSPYGFMINLGGEYLIGASPEMYVRVEGDRVETCPISGTIARGKDAIEDAERIRELLNSAKDEAELTMCTDVDRNDKARVCVPGTVRVIGRRQIELYSHLIHTVDHVEGRLKPGFDALDAFLSHCWAVTVTGAPKKAAMDYVEAVEPSPRRWYGGAIGRLTFDGNVNTGLTLRTIRLKDGIAEIRAGATLLYDSDPEAEERETHLKASALFRTIERAEAGVPLGADRGARPAEPDAVKPRVLLVDCEDSFTLTLADYLRQHGADLVTLRHNFAAEALDAEPWDLVVLSPGPGRPERFGVPALVAGAIARDLPVFGICLGLQGIVEALGGALGQLGEPVHGKGSEVAVSDTGSKLFQGLPDRFRIGRYHSLFAEPRALPAELRVTARTADGVIMAVEHATRPVAAVQFHPESILSLDQGAGHTIIANVLRNIARRRNARSP